MKKKKYINLQSGFIDLFDESWRDNTKQINVEERLAEIKFQEADSLKDYLIDNSKRQIIKNYIGSVANQINLYSITILKLEKWNELLEKVEEKEQSIFVLQDRIIPFSILLLTEPNILKNRIIFFYLTILDGDFELINIDKRYNATDFFNNKDYNQLASNRYKYDLARIKDILKKVNTDEIKGIRDHYTHKIARNVGMGYFSEFQVATTGSQSAVGLRNYAPIEISKIIELATSENDNLFKAFKELMLFFKNVINYT